MEKFSTAGRMTIFATTLCPLRYLRVFLSLSLCMSMPAFAATSCEWAPNAPEQHRVQRGDTLWDLAAIFLKNPWCWPRVWEPNQNLIRDPHWIYPGQVITLDRALGLLRLSDDNQNGLGFTRLSPGIRAEAADSKGIPLISRQLQMLIRRSPALTPDGLVSEPVVAGLPEERSMAGAGDIIIVRGDPGSTLQFDVLRPAIPISDPDTGEVLGVASLRVGQVRLLSKGEQAHRFLVTASSRELRLGDRLAPVTKSILPAVLPHPSTALPGKLAAILHEGRWAALHDIVAINRGARDGLDAGSVLRVVRQVKILANDSQQSNQALEERQAIAFLLVFEVTERVSLALVMRSMDAITTGDNVLPPEPLPQ